MGKRWIGIDLGGTSMKLGMVDHKGKTLMEMEKPTLAEEGADSVIGRIISHARELAEATETRWEDVAGVGVGLPGFLDIKNGVVKHMTNLGWNDEVPIRARLEEAWGIPVKIDNDANVAALGEAWCGAGVGVDDVVCITLGTGVGGGLIFDGQLIHGQYGFAGEVGHMTIDPQGHPCNCGMRGCLETISSATGMVRLAKEAIASGRKTVLADVPSINTKEIFAAAAAQDEVALHVKEKAIDALAQAMSTLSVLLNPARFIIGGGVSHAGDALIQPLREAYAKRTQRNARQGVEIVLAQLGNRAGYIGAAGLLARGKK
ncbi:ROK family protein [Laceyella putida]|uniref:Glucokinase n=1 Tax=Laceyella putida TaxID=110101 RepID=A0ABW2RG36_9BACL